MHHAHIDLKNTSHIASTVTRTEPDMKLYPNKQKSYVILYLCWAQRLFCTQTDLRCHSVLRLNADVTLFSDKTQTQVCNATQIRCQFVPNEPRCKFVLRLNSDVSPPQNSNVRLYIQIELRCQSILKLNLNVRFHSN